MTTRDIANQRIAFYLGTTSAIANLANPQISELNAMLPAHKAVRWSGLDLGMKASDKIDDRSLDDSATSQLRSFMNFGGNVPMFAPKVTDTSSILRQVFNLVKVPNTQLLVVERNGFQDRNTVWAAGDNYNLYHVLTGSFEYDTVSTGGYAYVESFVPQGDVYPWGIVGAASPGAITILGGATATLSLAGVNVALRGATYGGNVATPRMTWLSSNPLIATVSNSGVIQGLSVGTCTVTPSYPGSTASTGIAVTVGA